MNRVGSAKISVILIVVIGIGALLGSFWINGSRTTSSPTDNALAFTVFRGEFVASVVEPGDVESSSNIDIRCNVKARGRDGTSVIDIVPEGIRVEKGDFLAQLDDSVLRDELIQEQIQVAINKAAVIQAESDLETARSMLTEFEEGTYAQEMSTLEAERALAEESLRRARDYQRFSENLGSRGYINKTQMEADQFAVEKAELELRLAEQKINVYKNHTRQRMVGEMQAEIAKQSANLEAAEYTLQLSQQREADLQRQIDACRITAPAPGQVVYANEVDRRGDTSFVIEEGAVLRDSQPIFRLPDPNQMQVITKVSDSKINSVQVGQEALIRLDTDPEHPVKGVVSKVAAFPLPRRWYQAPIEYEVFVEVTEITEAVRPGLRAKVEIYVERLSDQLLCPISAIVPQADQRHVLVKTGTGFDLREVKLGSNNDAFVVIQEGLKAGEEVLVDPDQFLEGGALGDSSVSEINVNSE